MSALFPDFRDQVVAKAQDLAAPEPRRRSKRVTPPLAVLVALLVGVGGATAAGLTFWAPDTGTTADGAARSAVADPPPAGLLGDFAVLRRAPVADDQTPGVARAIRIARGPQYVRTNYVRRLDAPKEFDAFVIPAGDSPQAGSGDELCLWVSRADSPDGTTLCVSDREARRGDLRLTIGAALDTDMENRRAAHRRALERAAAARGGEQPKTVAVIGGPGYLPSELGSTVIGIAPDKVASVRVGDVKVAVARNVYVASVDEGKSSDVAFSTTP